MSGPEFMLVALAASVLWPLLLPLFFGPLFCGGRRNSMDPIPTRDATHSYGPPANWDAASMGPCGILSVRVQEGRGGVVESVSTWKPMPEEIFMLQHGGSVILTICGKQPAVALHVELKQGGNK